MRAQHTIIANNALIEHTYLCPVNGDARNVPLMVRMDMSEVRLEIMGSLAPCFGAQRPGRLVMNEAIEEGETVRDLLIRLVARHEGLGGVVFNTQTQELTDSVNLVLNDRLIDLVGGLDTRLKHGDIILFLTAIAGG